MSDWKTIGSAPRDGTEILVVNRENREMFVAFWADSWWQYATDRDGDPIVLPKGAISHWQTLPALSCLSDDD